VIMTESIRWNSNEEVRRKLDKIKKGTCSLCGKFSRELEFAHREPTGLKGAARGRNRRYYDYINNRDKYILICPECHDDYFDSFFYRKLLGEEEWKSLREDFSEEADRKIARAVRGKVGGAE